MQKGEGTLVITGTCVAASPGTDVDQPEVVILGTTPPPVTGMTLLTQQVVQGLQQAGRVVFFDWSTGISRRGLKFRIARVLRVICSIFWLMAHGLARNARLYVAANSKTGLYLTAIIVWIGRRLGYTIYLHHHTYDYIDRYDRRIAWINRTLGANGVHVMHTDQMARDFTATYRTESAFAFVYPSIVSAPLGTPRTSLAAPIQLGHLSNLSVAKGLDLVLATYRAICKTGLQARLKLAGTYHTKESRRMVQHAIEAYGELIEYVGPVYGQEKTDFFASIDCFVFPSRSESWGIVLHEALAAGVPVITYDRGCTRTVVGESAGLVVHPDADFPRIAAEQIKRWIDNPNEYRMASQAAIEQADHLQREGQRTLNEFVAHVFSRSLATEGLYRPN